MTDGTHDSPTIETGGPGWFSSGLKIFLDEVWIGLLDEEDELEITGPGGAVLGLPVTAFWSDPQGGVVVVKFDDELPAGSYPFELYCGTGKDVGVRTALDQPAYAMAKMFEGTFVSRT